MSLVGGFGLGQCPIPSTGTVDTMVSSLMQTLLLAQCAISDPNQWPPDFGKDALQASSLSGFDFVVIGAGSAGSVVASRLSENPKWKVLVLEAGGDPPQESEVPALWSSIQQTNFTWNYFTEPNMRLSNRRIYWPRGKCIGGTGAINAMLYVRGNRQDYDGWLRKGNPGWGYDNVLHYFEKALRPVGNISVPQGYLVVNEMALFDLHVQKMMRSSINELGIPWVTRFEEGSETGYTNLPATLENGVRMSTGKTYLGKVADRANLKVIKYARATRINFDKSGKRVKSVNFVLRDHQEVEVQVGKELVLSSGTIDSAKLLLLSGIGPKQHLDQMKVPIVHGLPVGENLQDHLGIPIFLKMRQSVVNRLEPLDSLYNYLIHRKGPLVAQSTVSLVGFINTLVDSVSPYPNIQFHHMYFKLNDMDSLRSWFINSGISERSMEYILEQLKTGDILLIYVLLSHPKSVGKIILRSSNYRDDPRIFPNYLAEPEDEVTLLGGIQHVMKLEKTQGFISEGAHLQQPPNDECDRYNFKSDEYWRCYVKYFSQTFYHHTGTVKMGPKGDDTACVDSRLRLHGVRNLRVIDASIMPNVTTCNTNAPTIMIAEKGADMIKEDN